MTGSVDSSRPRIGIVLNFDLERHVYSSAPAYSHAVAEAGGLPLLLPYLTSAPELEQIVDLLDGLILSGGGDFQGDFYDGEDGGAIANVVPARDAFELSLARAVLTRDVPVLGVCRGHQCLNLAAGGSLYPDLASITGEPERHLGSLDEIAHTVALESGTRLSGLVGGRELDVNSDHHQAVREVAPGFQAAALAPDGVIEAIEAHELRFAVGVQWHPERLLDSSRASRMLFRELVSAGAASARNRERLTETR